MVYETEKTLKELEGKISEEEKSQVLAAKDALAKALEGNDVEDIKAKTDALTSQFHAISAKMYQQAQAAGGAGAQGFDPSNMGNMGGAGFSGNAGQQSGPADDNVVDADFEVVDDKK